MRQNLRPSAAGRKATSSQETLCRGASGSDGSFRLSGPVGPRTLVVRRIGFRPESLAVSVDPGGVTEAFFDPVSGGTIKESQPNENVRKIERGDQRGVLGFSDSTGRQVDVYLDADGGIIRSLF